MARASLGANMARLFRRVFGKRRGKGRDPGSFSFLFARFKEILVLNNQVLEHIAETSDKLGGDYVFDRQFIRTASREICALVERMVFGLDDLRRRRSAALYDALARISREIEGELQTGEHHRSMPFVLPYHRLNRDDDDVAGGKNANLAALGNVLGVRIPRGVAVTAAAFLAFLEENDLRDFIATMLRGWQSGAMGPAEASQRIRARVLGGRLPKKLRRGLRAALREHCGSGPWVLRSSAIGEDGNTSFAGQYATVLNVGAEGIEDAYRQVVASLYNESALCYRQAMGLPQQGAMMAVACQEQIDATVSGVLYTHDPRGLERETLLLDAVWGLGGPLVAGEAQPDHFVVPRAHPDEILGERLATKSQALHPRQGGGVACAAVPDDRQRQPCLDRDQVRTIAETGLALERYWRHPLDIEFALDQAGALVILQARPLAIAVPPPRPVELSGERTAIQPLWRDVGEVAQQGIALGPVHLVRHLADLEDFPDGGILVVQYASPLYAGVLPRAAGLLTAVGSVSGHLATIAREQRVPALVNCGTVTDLLRQGQQITVDAEERVVYPGLVRELHYEILRRPPLAETSEYRLLRRVLRRIEPLHLLEPAAGNFTPAHCTSLHDITRYVHEMAIATLIDFHHTHQHTPGEESGRLAWTIPLDLVLLDIGGGLRSGVQGRIRVEQVASVPLRAILAGLAMPGAWENKPVAVDLGGFMSSLTRTLAPELASPQHLGSNLAVISAAYANLSLRLGYHFTMVDAHVSKRSEDNTLFFRFFGGVTGDERRGRRARFVAEILARHDFRVEVHGDFVLGRIKKLAAGAMLARLRLLGALIGYTRQLDALMVDEGQIAVNVQRFNTLMEADDAQNQHPYPGR